jgi:hypothetical protein
LKGRKTLHANKPNPVTGAIVLLAISAVLAIPFYGFAPALVIGAAVWMVMTLIQGLDRPSGRSGNKKRRRKKR